MARENAAFESSLRRCDLTGNKAKRRILENSNNAEAWRDLFRDQLAAGLLDAARFSGRRLMELEPDDLTFRLEVARLELAAGCPEHVIELLAGVAGKDRAAAALLACAHEHGARPQSADTLRRFASGVGPGFEDAGWRDYFADQIVAAIQADAAGGQAADGLLDALTRRAYEQAAVLLGAWRLRDSGSVLGDLVLADWLLLMGRVVEAKDLLESLECEHGGVGSIHNRLGDAALLLGTVESARAHYRKAILLDPEDTNGWLDLARTEFLLGNRDSAAAAANKAARQGNDVERAARQFAQELNSSPDEALGENSISGLAWWEGGGGVLAIEVQNTPDASDLRLTGNLGRELESSAAVAFRFLQSMYGLFDNGGAHLHFPSWNVHKDGASAGAAIAGVLYSAATERTITGKIAVTGELTLRGEVLPVGGIRGKLVAAHLHGIHKVLYPLANRADVHAVPSSARRTLQLAPVSDFEGVLRHLWPSK